MPSTFWASFSIVILAFTSPTSLSSGGTYSQLSGAPSRSPLGFGQSEGWKLQQILVPTILQLFNDLE